MELGKAEEIVEDLKQKIASSIIHQSEKLKSERDLASEYKVSRMTARRAIEILESEGLVTRYPIRGTFVGGIRERITIDNGREIQTNPLSTPIKESELRGSGSLA